MDQRKILHIDMDAFYASIEQRDRPELRGRPVVVGGKPEGRGVVAAASYEARAFGIRSAMSSAHAGRLCPHAVFVRPEFDKYREVSRQVMEIFRSCTSLVEPLSLDEAYLDVTENLFGESSATRIAERLRSEIFQRTSLTASAGAAPNKFLAKIASDMRKPNGLMVIPPTQVAIFLQTLPVGKIPGVGKVTEQRMLERGIKTTGDLQRYTLPELIGMFGKSGVWYYSVCRGEDSRPVVSNRERKSLSVEDTFSEDILDPSVLHSLLAELAEKLEHRLAKRELKGRTLTLKVTYSDFQKCTRSLSSDIPVTTRQQFVELGAQLLGQTEAGYRPIRLLGLGVHNFIDEASKAERFIQLRFSFLQ